MKSSTKNAIWLGVLIGLTTASLATAHAQNQDQAKPAGEEGAMKGGMPQMGGQGGMT